MSECTHECRCQRRSGGGVFRTLFSIALLYVTLVFGSGTLIKTEHPVAVEVGKLVQVVTFVEPTIRWAERSGHPALAGGLERLSGGVRIGPFAT
jgi:hypothetical protein